MLRRDGIKALLQRIDHAPIIANLGSATFDLYEEQDRDANFYTWGAMGMAASIGLGVALAAPDRKVFVTDGDGSLLMNLGSLGTIARQAPARVGGVFWGVLAALVTDLAPEPLRGTAFGVFHLTAGVAVLAANLMAGWLWTAFGAPVLFLAAAAVALISLLALMGWMRRTAVS